MLTDKEVREIARDLLWAGETFEAAGCGLPLEDQLRVCKLLEAWGHKEFRPDTDSLKAAQC